MVRHYGFQPLLSEGLSECEGTLRIEAAGYRPFGIDCIGLEWNRTRRRLDFGSIKYERRGDSFYQVRVILAPDI